MILRSRRRRESWLGNVWHRLKLRRSTPPSVLDSSAFELAIEKERCRAERRGLFFALLQFTPIYKNHWKQQVELLAPPFRNRLRITDEIGLYGGRFSVLLPETGGAQVGTVANDLEKLAMVAGCPVETEIFIFPESTSDWPTDTDSDRQVTPARLEAKTDELEDIAKPVPDDDELSAPAHSVALPRRVHKLKLLKPTPWWKRSIDLIGASLGTLLLSPILIGAALAVKLSSRGPVFFTQWREGKDGKVFKIYKFRTMRIGADLEKDAMRCQSEQDGPAFKIENDPRITWVGRYLRKTCVDELPQIINVLCGEMSIVGPRPLPVDESLNCENWHRRRLEVLPGMTCIWQVCGGRDIPFDDWMRMDRAYMRKRSLWMDAKIILKTAWVTLRHKGSV